MHGDLFMVMDRPLRKGNNECEWEKAEKINNIESIMLDSSIIYNIAFVNSECRLAKSRFDITLCQHGKFPAALNSNAYRSKCASYIIKNI